MKLKNLLVTVVIAFAGIAIVASTLNKRNSEIDLKLGKSKPLIVNGNTLMLGVKPSKEVLDLVRSYYGNSNAGEHDFTSSIGTEKMLEDYMSVNYEKVKNTEDNEKMDEYIRGYYENTNVRVLGGNTSSGYSSITVFNPTDKVCKVEDSYVKNIWFIDDTLDFEYTGIKTGMKYDSNDIIFSGYKEKTESDYSIREFEKIDGNCKVTIYVGEKGVNGIALSYSGEE